MPCLDLGARCACVSSVSFQFSYATLTVLADMRTGPRLPASKASKVTSPTPHDGTTTTTTQTSALQSSAMAHQAYKSSLRWPSSQAQKYRTSSVAVHGYTTAHLHRNTWAEKSTIQTQRTQSPKKKHSRTPSITRNIEKASYQGRTSHSTSSCAARTTKPA